MESIALLVIGAAILGYTLGMGLGMAAAVLAALPVGDSITWTVTGIFGMVAAAGGSYVAMALQIPNRGIRLALTIVGAALLLTYALTVDEVEGFS